MQKNKFAQFEFVTLMASLMSIVALAIDALLPALDIIGITIGTRQVADNQLLITMIFLGLGIGPLFFGPISDSIGRKPVVYMGLLLFIIASFICVFATSIEMMVLGRILQGIGLSAPRTIAIAMIRDIYSGDYMARIMSFITVVFLLVPIIAPALGKFVLDHYDWQAIFYVQVLFSILVSFWFWKRQAETLEISKRIKFTSTIFIDGLKELMQYKTTIGYTLISGFIVGSFMVYLSTSQQVFEQQYQLKEEFPYIFGLLAISIGSAIFLNGTLVLKYGMEKLVTTSLLAFFAISLLYIVLFYNSSNPSVGILLLFFGMQFFAIGFLFGNLRALAMQPIGHIAGIGAAITGFVSTIMAVPISTYIGRFVLGTTLPLFIGFLVCALLSIVILVYLKVSVKQQRAT
ncbi:DHA1 family bicyclomycin/chloramphenicol resistance-like MFS transporter [Aquimarina sp. EL_43]|uniref:multidrug effflux MFS transporter n=1 Tax=unclassified Aquimarina TaxID=2627091 RepID=UPI0018C8D93A|nr:MULTISPECIES: multidrug effflux MFS transporter [unclassified Aquimarina]MBG6129533.1 DHA1 family bicyclomycin/chloramphenicol resistance-like MFS transporter [Aquimarina sp. EL_35]MBG6150598.1 DHA1 family bicyclomycin/chloramphenicol resistance-like MFS transporter [Aquimarina sp. EL_32]MBG6168094.1 DHA1 family bicyclomycin/chloramphenicol resistance-like MFS transporter [Aquimarina sp. EL_43]